MKALAVALLLLAAPLLAQTAHEDLTALEDNSFLLEEAYNQEPGVVQHIGVFTRTGSEQWELVFTEEWPLGNQRHQLSYDIPLVHDGGTNLGDVSINYRYQLVGGGDSDLAISPRLTAILATSPGDAGSGLAIGLPISRVLAPRVASHTNLEVSWQDGTELALGQSLVYAFSSRVHLLVEGTYTRPDEGDSELIVGPGVRWSYSRPSGLQIVPGVAALFGGDDDAILLYLSFEHPFRR